MEYAPEEWYHVVTAKVMKIAYTFYYSTEEGLQSWMETYNAGLAAGTQPRIPLPGEQRRSAGNLRDRIKIVSPNRARMAKASRKKNRKKK